MVYFYIYMIKSCVGRLQIWTYVCTMHDIFLAHFIPYLLIFLDSPGWQPHSCFLLLFLAVSFLAVISQYLNFLILPLLLSRRGTCRPSSASMTALWRWPQWLRVLRWRWSCCVWLGWRISSRLMSGPLWRSSAMQASRSVGWGGVGRWPYSAQ